MRIRMALWDSRQWHGVNLSRNIKGLGNPCVSIFCFKQVGSIRQTVDWKRDIVCGTNCRFKKFIPQKSVNCCIRNHTIKETRKRGEELRRGCSQKKTVGGAKISVYACGLG